MSTAARVIRNTGFLYAKMGITAFLALYTTRLILASLGASDFGIFNIVGGAIAMLCFLNGTMTGAIQRFMSVAEGRGDRDHKRHIFNVSCCLQAGLGGLTALALLLAMGGFFGGVLNIHPDRIFAAQMVYLCLIANTIIANLCVPYEAVMTSHENMLYYSLIGISDAALKLGVAFVCVYTSQDKLIVYAVLMLLVPLLNLLVLVVYCHKNYAECVLSVRRYWDFAILKEMLSFSCWTFLTVISSMVMSQGLGIVLNHFFGTILNAAQGIANQLSSQLSSLSLNLMKALNPVIMKRAGANNTLSMHLAAFSGCKFSTLIIMIVAIPAMLELPYILDIWLKEVPPWTTVFCTMQLAQSILNQTTSAVATEVYATGKMKSYCIWKSIFNFLPLPVAWLCFQLGGSPVWLYVPSLVLWILGGNIIVLYFAHQLCKTSFRAYAKRVLAPITGVTLSMLAVGFLIHFSMEESFMRLIICTIGTSLALLFYVLLFGLSAEERGQLTVIILRHAKRKHS